MAILVNNKGAQTTNGEIIACLWEDDGDPKVKASYLSNLRQDLQNTFSRLRLNGIILKQRGSLAIATDRIECDLFDWLEKKQESRYKEDLLREKVDNMLAQTPELRKTTIHIGVLTMEDMMREIG